MIVNSYLVIVQRMLLKLKKIIEIITGNEHKLFIML